MKTTKIQRWRGSKTENTAGPGRRHAEYPPLTRLQTATRGPLGRGRLALQVRTRRWRWRWLVDGPRVTKRIFDVLAAAAALLLASPLLLLIAAMIKLDDSGPVIFRQTRVGMSGRRFVMYKFRSMCPDAEARLAGVLARNRHGGGVTFKLENDPRLTRAGKRLRRTSLDELPQLYNVLKGDMTLVGPRPPLPREAARYSPADRRRLAVKPSLTCLWQIHGRSRLDFSQQVKLDIQYIEDRNFWFDVKILFKTVPAVLSGDGAC